SRFSPPPTTPPAPSSSARRPCRGCARRPSPLRAPKSTRSRAPRPPATDTAARCSRRSTRPAAPDAAPTARAGMLRVEHVMGMPVSLDLADDLPAERLEHLADEAFAWLREVDARFSTYKTDSEVTRLARGELRVEECSADLREVLDRCGDLWRATDGYFDVYAAGALDPSGYV